MPAYAPLLIAFGLTLLLIGGMWLFEFRARWLAADGALALALLTAEEDRARRRRNPFADLCKTLGEVRRPPPEVLLPPRDAFRVRQEVDVLRGDASGRHSDFIDSFGMGIRVSNHVADGTAYVFNPRSLGSAVKIVG